MKNKSRLLFSSIITVTFASLANNASADVTKANNGDALNVGSSYSLGGVPTGSDLLLVNATMPAAQTAALGGNVSVKGISASSGFNLIVTDTPGAILSIGASGIVMTSTGQLTLRNATTLTANQNWALGSTQLNINNLTTGGNTLGISGTDSTKGKLSFSTGSATLGTEVTIGTLAAVYVQSGTFTFNGINNTNTAFNSYGGTTNIASMGNVGGASSIGKGGALVRSGATLNYTGNTFSSDKGFARDNNNGISTAASAVNVTTAGQTLSMSGNLTNTAAANSGWTFGGVGNLSLSGVISNSTGTGTPFTTVTKKDAGTLTLSGTNTYSGTTTVSGGTLLATKAAALPGYNLASKVSAASGTTLAVRAGGASEWISSEIDTLLGSTPAAFTSGSNLGIDVTTGNNFSYASDIGATQAAKGLVKTGTGILTLSASNTFTGATSVSAGTLLVTGALASNVSVSDLATLGGGGTVGTISFGGASFFDIFQAIGSSNPLDATTISFSTSGFGIDNLVSSGSAVNWASIADGTYTLITGTLNTANLGNFGLANAYDIDGGLGSRTAYFENGSLKLVVVPEPNTASLLGGLGTLLLLRRRR